MAITAHLPNGTRVEFPDGTSPEMMTQAVQGLLKNNGNAGGGVAPGDAKSSGKPERGFWGETGHQLSFGARNVLEGFGEIPGAFINMPWNGTVGQLFPSLKVAENPGVAIADYLGLDKAEGKGEEMLGAIERGGTGFVPWAKAGQVVSEIPNIPRYAKAIGEMFAAAPWTQLLSGMGAGAASKAAEQEGLGTGAQIAAGLGGAFGPAMLASGVQAAFRAGKAGARAFEALTPSGQERIAAENIRQLATRPDDLVTTIEKSNLELVPGSKSTLGQVTADPGLAVAEKGRASTAPDRALYGERYRDQARARQDVLDQVGGELTTAKEARQAGLQGVQDDLVAGREAQQAELNSVLDSLEARQAAREAGVVDDVNGMKAIPGGYDIPERDNGDALAGIFRERYGAERARTKATYDAIDPEGTATFNIEPLRQSFDEVLPQGPFAPKLPGDIQRIVGQMDDAIANGRPATYRDLQYVRTQLRGLADGAAAQGDANLGRMAGGMKKRLDEWLDTIPAPGDAIMPKPGSKAYRYLENEARASLGPASDPFGVDLQYMRKLGINKDWLVNNIGPHAPAELNKMYPGLVRESGTFIPDVSAGSLQTKFARGDEIYDALKNYYPTYAGRNSAVAKTVDDLLWANRIEPTGFTDAQAQAFKDAKFQRAQQGQLFEENFNTAMSRGQLRPDQVMGNYFKAGPAGDGAARDFLRAFGDDPRAAQIMKDHIASSFHRAVTKNGKLDAAAMEKWLLAHSAALDNFPDVKLGLNRILTAQRMAERAAAGTGRTISRAAKDSPALLGKTPVDVPDLVQSGAATQAEAARLQAIQRKQNADAILKKIVDQGATGSAKLGKLQLTKERADKLVKDGALTRAQADRLMAIQAAENASGVVKQVINNTPNVAARLGKAPLTDQLGDYLVKRGAMTQQQVKNLQAVQADVARQRTMDQLGAVRGSPTAQNLATQAIMDTILGKSLGRKVNGLGATPGGIIRNIASGAFNRSAEFLYGKADDKINRILDQAFLDPTVAADLLKKYKPYIPKVSMGDIVKNSGKAATAQTVRNILHLLSERAAE